MAKAKARLAAPVQYLVDQYREQFGDVTFDQERHAAAFGDTFAYDDARSSIGTMTDEMLVQVILMDLFSRAARYENEIERLLGVIDDSSKVIGNRAARRKK